MYRFLMFQQPLSQLMTVKISSIPHTPTHPHTYIHSIAMSLTKRPCGPSRLLTYQSSIKRKLKMALIALV